MPTPVPTASIRQWARAQGLDVAERGRLKPEIVHAYDAAQRRAKAPAKAAKSAPAAKSKPPAADPKRSAARTAAAAPTPTPKAVPDAVEVAQDHRLADLETALTALAGRVAKLEAAPTTPPAKKRFGRKV